MRAGLRPRLAALLSAVLMLVAAGPPESPVADAAMRGDAQTIMQLLQGGADVNAAQGDGMTALHWAAERDDVEMARILVAAGADLQAMTRIGGYVPLHVAATEGAEKMVRWLLEAGADVNRKTTETKATALHMAAFSGDLEVVRLLLDHGADPNLTEDHWLQTPLVFAASQNRAAVVRLLIERGADPNVTTFVRDLEEWSTLMRAADERRDEVLAAFTNDGAREPTSAEMQIAVRAGREVFTTGVPEEEEGDEGNRRFRRGPPSITAKGGLSPLLHAVRQGHQESVLALLEGGADPNLVSPADGTSPLLMASLNGEYDIARLLVEQGADPNIASTLNGVTPLWAVVNSEWQPRTRYPQPQQHMRQNTSYLDLMRVLLDAGADPNHRISMHPWYMVYTGCGNGNCGLIDTDGATAFLRAAYATDVQAMRLLVEYGADPNIPTRAPEPRRRSSAEDFLGQQNVTQLQDDEKFATLDDSAKVQLMRSVRDVFPDEVRYRFDDELFMNTAPDVLRQQFVTAIDEAAKVLENQLDPSGLPQVEQGGPAVYPIHAAAGVGYGEGFAGNAHRHVPNAWLPAVRYLVEELGVDINVRDHNGYNAVHHAAARGDNAMIMYLVERGADVLAVSRRGQTTVDMANGPVQRVSPFPATVALLESLGALNNNNCLTC